EILLTLRSSALYALRENRATRSNAAMLRRFERGRIYSRRQHIHAAYGGQQQGGISTPAEHRVIFAFTGKSGAWHGYSDGWTPDGVFQYFGEGQEGDMRMVGGNRAIRDHARDAKDLLLFENLSHGRVRFMGQFVSSGFSRRTVPDRTGKARVAFMFNLVPLEDA